MDRSYWQREIDRLDPERDWHRIYAIDALHEFPWDINQALSFALYRTYAVPSIGSLLAQTGEFAGNVQKRYDDTGLILSAILEHGFDSSTGRDALRRMNQMHRAYDISSDDMRYVLSTFVTIPIRWLDDVGWRPLSEAEKVATSHYYQSLGRHMGITGIPATYADFADLLETYEAAHFAFDEAGVAVSELTLQLMATFPPNQLLPAAVSRRFAFALMDDALLDAFHYPHPSGVERAAARGALRTRSRLLRHRPPRLQPKGFGDFPQVRSYPEGYDVSRLGTFPPTCPVRTTGTDQGR